MNKNKLPELFANNRAWAEGIVKEKPDFFRRLSAQQNPKYLWIGCADSRVPANEIIGLMPGEVFVHRNVANVVVHTDLNCLSVLQYAVDVLKVEHVIVCGHYGCGGVQAAYGNASLGLIDNWLRHVKDVAEKYESDIGIRPTQETRLDRLCELNVIEQVLHVCRTTIVLDAWARGQPLNVHGWVYRLQSGLLKEIGVDISGAKELETFLAQKVMPGATF
ncbi:MAG TPA: carbonate dehydratase [Gammaproteobacteria bacterium]|jgi:carbonic anhydrase|nr:carbonate dehydratase [Gammaproteobacteria bacterium]